MNVLKSLLILFSISCSISLLFSKNIIDYIKYFLSISLIQIILYQIYLKIVSIFIEKIKLDKIKEYSKQGMEVSCPCYKANKVFIPIRLNGNNDFKCLECNKNVSVTVDVKTFLATEPLDGDATDAALLMAIEKIKQSPE
jgi:hypothetical protein